MRDFTRSTRRRLLCAAGIVALVTAGGAAAAGRQEGQAVPSPAPDPLSQAAAPDRPAQAARADTAAIPTQSAATPQDSGLGDVIVTARRRDENLQTVPVAVSVVSAAEIATKGTFTPYDLQAVTTGLTVASSAGDKVFVNYSIRGQTQTTGTLFPAVVTYFNEVPVTRFAQGDFFDLSNIQVLRGPQGVLFGRVTDGGNVMIAPQRPTDRFEGYAEVKVGDYSLHNFDGAINIPIIGDKLMIRGAFEIDRRDGYTINTYNGADLDNSHSDAFRISVVLKPTSWFENYTVVNYQNLNQNGNGSVITAVNPAAVLNSVGALALFPGAYGIAANGQIFPYQAGLTPLTPASFVAAVQGDLARQQARSPRDVYQPYPSFYKLKNLFVTNTTTINLSDNVSLKNVFGYTTQKFDSSENLTGENSGLFQQCSSQCANGGLGIGGPDIPKSTQRQLSEEVRLAGRSFHDNLNWSVGFYTDRQDPDGASERNLVAIGVLQNVLIQNDHTRSIAGFVSGEYDFKDLLPGLKINAGYRYTQDTDRSQDNRYLGLTYPAAALPALTAALTARGLSPAVAAYVANPTVYPNIPYGQCVSITSPSILGPFPCTDTSVSSHAHTGTVGASYEITHSQLVYARVSRGYRPGGVNAAAPAGLPPSYAPDYDTSVELGYKGDWRIGSMPVRTDIALFHDDYTDIQKQVIVASASGAPSNLIRNIASATIQGVEFEGTIKPADSLTLRVNYAFTDARSKHNDTSGPSDPCNPANFSILGFCTDNRFAYTPRHALTLGFDYRLPASGHVGTIRFGGDMRYRSSEALSETSALNPASVIPPLATVDLNASWSDVLGKPIDLTFFMTNATDALYKTGIADL